MRKILRNPFAWVMGLGLFASTAFAAPVDVLGQQVEINTTAITNMAGAIILAIAAIWGIKKVIALGNKS